MVEILLIPFVVALAIGSSPFIAWAAFCVGLLICGTLWAGIVALGALVVRRLCHGR